MQVQSLHCHAGQVHVAATRKVTCLRSQASVVGTRLLPSCASSAASRHRNASLRCTALFQAKDDANKAPTPVQTGKIGKIELTKDNESWQDVMAFTGPAPERVNGRLAMLAFVAVVFGELTTGKSVLEQVPTVPFRIAFVSALISIASIVPKYSSGTSLQELTEAASRTGLPPQLRFFNKTHEVWVGRVAMLGFTGLIGVELFKGGKLF